MDPLAAALILGVLLAAQSTPPSDEAAAIVFTDALARRYGRWQVIASQGTMVAP